MIDRSGTDQANLWSRPGRWWRLLVLCFLALCTGLVPPAMAGSGLEHACIKIQPDAPYNAAGSIHLYAARNEYESYQVVLNGPLTGVAPTASALVGASGSLAATATRFSRVRYLDISTPSNDEGMIGLVPDALVPQVDLYYGEARNAFPIDVPAGENRLIWVDLFVPEGTVAGDYQGNVTISSDQGVESLAVTVTVWSFSLPSTSSLTTAFGYEGWGVLFGHFNNPDDHYDDIVPLAQAYLRAALIHRFTLSTVLIEDWDLYDDPIDWPAFDARWQEFFDGTDLPHGLQGARVTSVQIPTIGSSDQAKVAFWTGFVQHFRSKGWFDLLFDYTLDEPGDNAADYQTIKDRAALVHQADPDLAVLVTTDIQEAAPYGVENDIDIWVPLINFMHLKPYGVCWAAEYEGDQRSEYDGLVAAGKRLWSYQSCMSHGCYTSATDECNRAWPSYMVDHTAVRNRIMGWQSYRYDLMGELYFDVNYAYGNSDPWVSQLHFGGNGDGNIFYPGRPSDIGGTTHIPVESIRLKQIRDGLEDYEYLLQLEQMQGRAAVLALISTVLTNTYTYTSDPASLLGLRQSIGELLDAALFADGFESGNTWQWSVTVP
jgi:hypothetical protein